MFCFVVWVGWGGGRGEAGVGGVGFCAGLSGGWVADGFDGGVRRIARRPGVQRICNYAMTMQHMRDTPGAPQSSNPEPPRYINPG